MSMNLSLMKKIRCRFLDRSTGMPVPGVIASLSVAVGNSTKSARFPIGTLCTDATGYMSFDVKPIDLELPSTFGLFISAPEFGLANYDLLGSLVAASRDETKNRDVDAGGSEASSVDAAMMMNVAATVGQNKHLPCIVFPIYLENRLPDEHGPESASCGPTRLPSIQSPDVCDYKVSPFSFVTPTALKLGNDCCEILLPSSLPIQQYRFYKIVVRQETTTPIDNPQSAPEVRVFDALKSRAPVIKFGEILEYRQEWYSLGHSLGEIKYSLPLAPGESTQLAVIEWSRDDLASRTDKIRGTEFLNHDSRRDRAIEETVDAALKEEQGGNSWALGTSGTASGNTYGTGMWTGNHAIGGGISYSYGKRDLEGESLQDLHDRVRQASSFVRSLNSTVIVQGSQTETNALQTRRVANHNHCHAVTIQYYEVLRHYRMSTKFSGRREAVLVPFAPFTFSWQLAIRFRTILEKALLDPSLKNCFEALVRLNVLPEVYDAPLPPKLIATTDPEITELEKTVEVKTSEGKGKLSGVKVRKGDKIKMTASGFLAVSGVNGYGSGGFPPEGDGITGPIAGGYPLLAPTLKHFSLIYKIGQTGLWRQGGTLDLTADENGEIIFGVNTLPNGFVDFNNAAAPFWTAALKYPSHGTDVPTPTDPSKDDAWKNLPFRKIDDQLCSARLLKHLESNQGFYNSAVWMLMDAVERRLYLEQALHDRQDILGGMDDRPIAVSGNHVAFEYRGPSPQPSAPAEEVEEAEDIVTLPTRGLFAEAQMGHCNSCEKRDVTRMWDWTEMTAETPPEISGISPGPKGVAPSIAQGQLPSNVIQITQPQAAPNPTGLANALNVLKTPHIFQDMAGLDEVSKLLGELAKASGDANTKAMAMQAKEKVDAMKKPTDPDTETVVPSGVSAVDAADRFSLLPEIKSFAKDVRLTGDEYKQFALDQMYGTRSTGNSIGKTPKGTKSTRSVTPASVFEIVFRAFIPAPAVPVISPSAVIRNLLGAPSANSVLIGFSGDGRDVSYFALTFRGEILVQVTTDSLRGPMIGTPVLHFGETVQWNDSQIKYVTGMPWWWFAIKAGETSTKRHTLVRTPDNLDVTVTRDNADPDLIHIHLRIDARIAADDAVIASMSPTITGDLVLSIWEKPGYTPHFSLSGTHDGFPGYELFINGKSLLDYNPRNVTSIGPLALAGLTDRQNVSKLNVTIPGVIPGR